MLDIVSFQKSVFANSVSNLLIEFDNSSEVVKEEFIHALREQNLDLLFHSYILGSYDQVKKSSHSLISLKRHYNSEKARDGFYLSEFLKILNHFETPLILLKGWGLREFLGLSLYKRSLDVDILVSEAHYSKSIDILTENFSFYVKPKYMAYGQTCLLREDGMSIDLHKKLIAFQGLDEILGLGGLKIINQKCFEKSDNGFVIFNVEMMFLHLLIHFVIHHNASGFLLLFEIRTYIKKIYDKIDVETFRRISREFNASPIVRYGLLAIENVCVLTTAERKWVHSLLGSQDNKTAEIFKRSFSVSAFYKGKEVPKSYIKKLVVRNVANEISYLKGKAIFSIHCNIQHLTR